MKTEVYKNNKHILTADFVRLGLKDKDIIEEILQNTDFITFNQSNYKQVLENPDYYLFAMLGENGSLLASTAIELNYAMQYFPLNDEILNCKNLTIELLKNFNIKTEQVGFIGAGYVPYTLRNKNYCAMLLDSILLNIKSAQYSVGLTSDGINFLKPKNELLHCEIMFEKRGFEKRGPSYIVKDESVKTVYQFIEV